MLGLGKTPNVFLPWEPFPKIHQPWGSGLKFAGPIKPKRTLQIEAFSELDFID